MLNDSDDEVVYGSVTLDIIDVSDVSNSLSTICTSSVLNSVYRLEHLIAMIFINQLIMKFGN